MKTINTIATIMKKIIPILLVAVIFAAAAFDILKLTGKYSSNNDKKAPTLVEKPTPIFGKALKPIYGYPVRIIISAVGIDAQVEPVNVAADGSLETPKTWKTVGWYEEGAEPGQPGNLLINAHYDDNFGKPAAFWQLKNVNLDDKVTVVDSYGRRYEYKVIGYNLVSINDPNRADVFKSDESAKITLITCGGVWIPGKATYDKRLVIKGELIR